MLVTVFTEYVLVCTSLRLFKGGVFCLTSNSFFVDFLLYNMVLVLVVPVVQWVSRYPTD